MKTLIQKSIEIYGMGHPDTKTIFHLNEVNPPNELTKKQEIENEKILKDIRFKSLTTISGRKLTVWFKYLENEKEVEDRIQLIIIKSENENEIKQFILESINSKLK